MVCYNLSSQSLRVTCADTEHRASEQAVLTRSRTLTGEQVLLWLLVYHAERQLPYLCRLCRHRHRQQLKMQY